MDSVKIYVNNQEYTVNKNSTILDFINNNTDKFKDIIISKVDLEYTELTYKIKGNERIELFDLHEKEANRIYLNGLIFVMDYCFKKLFDITLKINHSLDKGLYITTSKYIDENILLDVEKYMNSIVDKNIPIEKLTISRKNAIDYYKNNKKLEKADNITYLTNTYLTMYKLDDYYDYFYSLMPVSTGVLKLFRFNLIDNYSFVLTFPTIYMTDSIKRYEHRENVFNMFYESKEWANRLGLKYTRDLNKIVSSGDISKIMLIDEMEKNNKISDIANKISINNNIRIVLIAGPSSSGKTTTTNKLSLALRSKGKNPYVISMDDFFVEKEDTPLDSMGNPDYECLEALDLDLFNKTIKSLLDNKDTVMPEFNFLTGKKEYKNRLRIDDDDILLIEGIHAMNPKILDNIDKSNKVKIYLSALSELNVDRDVRISTTDNRLLRRIVRDNRTRGYNVEVTLKMWSKVREGEEKYIFPYQDMADYTINTALLYEIGVLKVYVEPLLYSVDMTSDYYEEAKRLLNFLRIFLPIASENIPNDSILREFIGGGCFKI